MWVIFAFGSALFAGITSIVVKIGLQNVNSNLATALRTIVVLVCAWGMVFIVGSQTTLAQVSSHSLVFLVLSGLATGASWLCYFRALQTGDVNKVVPIDKSNTVLTMLLALLFLGEAVTPLKVLCMLLILAGTYWMIEKKEADEKRKQKGGWLIYAVLSAVFASLTAILGKVGIENVEANLGTAVRTAVVLVMAWVVVFVTGAQKGLPAIKARNWLFLAISGVTTGLSWLCYYRALQAGPASVVVPVDKLSILVTVGFAYVFFHERLSRKAAAGLACIVAGTLLLLAPGV